MEASFFFLGQVVSSALNPGEAFIKIVHEQLVSVMGEANDALNLSTTPPAVILMAGLQGAGKTTTVATLARLLKERPRKKVAVVSADVYRPAAIKQLEVLANEVGAIFLPSNSTEEPLAIARRAVQEAKTQFADVLLVDTAGYRCHASYGKCASRHTSSNTKIGSPTFFAKA